MHHQMRMGNTGMDFLNAIDSKNVAGRRTSEFVRTVASAARDGQCIHAGGLDELSRFLRIGKHLF